MGGYLPYGAEGRSVAGKKKFEIGCFALAGVEARGFAIWFGMRGAWR